MEIKKYYRCSFTEEEMQEMLQTLKDGHLKEKLQGLFDSYNECYAVDKKLYNAMLVADDLAYDIIAEYYDDVYDKESVVPVLMEQLEYVKKVRTKFFDKRDALEERK